MQIICLMQDNRNGSEARFVYNLSKGNLLAFNTLFNEYSGRLYRFAYGYLKSEDEAEELVQEVFTIIWEKRAELKEELSFKSFIFTIAFNIIRKHFMPLGTPCKSSLSRKPAKMMMASPNPSAFAAVKTIPWIRL